MINAFHHFNLLFHVHIVGAQDQGDCSIAIELKITFQTV